MGDKMMENIKRPEESGRIEWKMWHTFLLWKSKKTEEKQWERTNTWKDNDSIFQNWWETLIFRFKNCQKS